MNQLFYAVCAFGRGEVMHTTTAQNEFECSRHPIHTTCGIEIDTLWMVKQWPHAIFWEGKRYFRCPRCTFPSPVAEGDGKGRL